MTDRLRRLAAAALIGSLPGVPAAADTITVEAMYESGQTPLNFGEILLTDAPLQLVIDIDASSPDRDPDPNRVELQDAVRSVTVNLSGVGSAVSPDLLVSTVIFFTLITVNSVEFAASFNRSRTGADLDERADLDTETVPLIDLESRLEAILPGSGGFSFTDIPRGEPLTIDPGGRLDFFAVDPAAAPGDGSEQRLSFSVQSITIRSAEVPVPPGLLLLLSSLPLLWGVGAGRGQRPGCVARV